MPYHTIPYQNMPYHTIPNHTTLYHTNPVPAPLQVRGPEVVRVRRGVHAPRTGRAGSRGGAGLLHGALRQRRGVRVGEAPRGGPGARAAGQAGPEGRLLPGPPPGRVHALLAPFRLRGPRARQLPAVRQRLRPRRLPLAAAGQLRRQPLPVRAAQRAVPQHTAPVVLPGHGAPLPPQGHLHLHGRHQAGRR